MGGIGMMEFNMFRVMFGSVYIIGIPVFSEGVASISGPAFHRDEPISLSYYINNPISSGCTVERME
jgi:hypothetical protein